jgi:hypothetical protein
MDPELCPGHDFDELIEGAVSTGEGDEGISMV